MTWRYSPQVVWGGGLSYVKAADSFGLIGRLTEDALFAYVMTGVNFLDGRYWRDHWYKIKNMSFEM